MRQWREARVAFALDCCDREAMGHVATSGGITADDVKDLMVAIVEHRYDRVNRAPDRRFLTPLRHGLRVDASSRLTVANEVCDRCIAARTACLVVALP